MDNKKVQNLIQEESIQFAFDSIDLINKLPRNFINQILVKQYLRSSTSIGANVEEALGGHTKNDFTHSMNIAKKEARESLYWLKLLLKANSECKLEIGKVGLKCNSIVKILTKIVKTSRENS